MKGKCANCGNQEWRVESSRTVRFGVQQLASLSQIAVDYACRVCGKVERCLQRPPLRRFRDRSADHRRSRAPRSADPPLLQDREPAGAQPAVRGRVARLTGPASCRRTWRSSRRTSPQSNPPEIRLKLVLTLGSTSDCRRFVTDYRSGGRYVQKVVARCRMPDACR